MGFLKYIPFLRNNDRDRLVKLPSGTFTLDAEGHIISSTLPRTFPLSRIREIGRCVMNAFRLARQSQVPLTELNLHYATLKITAREMKGGAVVFLMPLHTEKGI